VSKNDNLDYKLLTSEGLKGGAAEFEKLVKQHLEREWRLFGALQVVNNVLVRELVRDKAVAARQEQEEALKYAEAEAKHEAKLKQREEAFKVNLPALVNELHQIYLRQGYITDSTIYQRAEFEKYRDLTLVSYNKRDTRRIDGANTILFKQGKIKRGVGLNTRTGRTNTAFVLSNKEDNK
jgi:hypothetical protein